MSYASSSFDGTDAKKGSAEAKAVSCEREGQGCRNTLKEKFLPPAKPKGIAIGAPTFLVTPAPDPEKKSSEFGDDDYPLSAGGPGVNQLLEEKLARALRVSMDMNCRQLGRRAIFLGFFRSFPRPSSSFYIMYC